MFWSTGSLLAQLDRSKVPAPGPAPEIRIATPQQFTLENGLKVFLVENNKLPRVAFSLSLNYDPVMEKDKAGYVQMAGSLLRRGTISRSKDQIDEEVDFIGATLSTSSTGVYAASLKQHTEQLLTLMADVLLNPTFPAEELEKLRRQTLSGLQSAKDNPDAIANNVRAALLFGKDHPYGELTTEESVSAITTEDCRKFYQTYFRPNIASLVIVGDITRAEAETLVRRFFSGWLSGQVPAQTYAMKPRPQQTEVALVDRPQSVQSNIIIAYPVEMTPGHPDAIKADIMNRILGGGFSGRLFANLREKHGYTYGAYSTLASDRLIGRFQASANVRNAVTDSAVVQFFYEMERMRGMDVEEEELERMKNFVIGNFARSLENPATVAQFALNIDRYNLPADYYTTYLQKVQAVTVADIREMAQKYIRPDNAYVIVVGKAEEVAKPLANFGTLGYYDNYGNPYVKADASAMPAGMTAADVLNKYIDAIGGKAKVEAIRDVSIKMTAAVGPQKLEITEVKKGPNRWYNSVQMGGMTLMEQKYDGNRMVRSQQGRMVDIPAEERRNAPVEAAMFPELEYGRRTDVKTELKGIERVDGRDAFVVEVTLPGGKKESLFFDCESGLKVRQSQVVFTPQGDMVLATEFRDFKEVNGVMFPHTRVIPLGPQRLQAQVESIRINTNVSDQMF